MDVNVLRRELFDFLTFSLTIENWSTHRRQMNDRLYIKIKENIDKYQSLYLIRNVTKKVIPDNYVESFEKFGFNLVSNALDSVTW